jgi:hypothetical protein
MKANKIKDFLKDLWERAKGNRTIFLQMIWIAIEAGLIPVTGPWLVFVRGILGLLVGKTIYEHQKAGFFNNKKKDNSQFNNHLN